MISIRAPRAGRDTIIPYQGYLINISIRAPRAGRDRKDRIKARGHADFNPRAPCGARRYP